MNSTSGVAFAMTIGPGEAEMAIDTMQAIRSLYPQAVIWVRDDATSDGTYEAVAQWAVGQPVHISRNSSPYGYYRIVQTFGELLSEIAASHPALVIKVDPDTVLLRPGLVELFEARFRRYGAGICGSYKTSAGGAYRDSTHHRNMMLLDLQPVGPIKKQKSLRWGPVSDIRHLIRAMRNGYELGDNIQGGLYAIDGGTLEKMAASGFLKAAYSGQRGMTWGEDIMLTMGAKSVGGMISPLNEDDGPKLTHIQADRPLPVDAISFSDLLAVHPVKTQDAELRGRLRSMREEEGTASA